MTPTLILMYPTLAKNILNPPAVLVMKGKKNTN